MKNFRVCNNDIENWKEYYIANANEVVDVVTNRSAFKNGYEIEWRTPVTGEYTTIVKKDGDEIIFNANFKIPTVFKELI